MPVNGTIFFKIIRYPQGHALAFFPAQDWPGENAIDGSGDTFRTGEIDFLVTGLEVKVMTVHNDLVPVHANFKVTITDDTVVNKDKTFIASIDGKRKSYNSTKVAENTFTIYTKNLGQFTLALDTIAPRISIGKFIKGKSIGKDKTIVFKITDEMSGIKSYNGFLNEKWVLFEYDNKSARIVYQMNEEDLVDGENQLKMIVSDNLGNSAIFETSFFRSQKK